VTTLKDSRGASTFRDGCAAQGHHETPAAQWAQRLPDPAGRNRHLFLLKSRKRAAARASGVERLWESMNRQPVTRPGASTNAIDKNPSLA
jgi:hypothetical protein